MDISIKNIDALNAVLTVKISMTIINLPMIHH